MMIIKVRGMRRKHTPIFHGYLDRKVDREGERDGGLGYGKLGDKAYAVFP